MFSLELISSCTSWLLLFVCYCCFFYESVNCLKTYESFLLFHFLCTAGRSFARKRNTENAIWYWYRLRRLQAFFSETHHSESRGHGSGGQLEKAIHKSLALDPRFCSHLIGRLAAQWFSLWEPVNRNHPSRGSCCVTVTLLHWFLVILVFDSS